MASSTSEFGQEKDEEFKTLFSSRIEDFVSVSKFRSRKSGITIYICDVGGPTVNGYICLATEAHDDDGLPHTLEHLIFLGSEDYPFKGVLDLLANRCFASGTNAWTATDHTCYTVMTAGSDGFLNFLPVYLEHILYPTLLKAGFITEVHHINIEGKDGGVVYCEMQSVENTGESLVHNTLMQEMYPGDCGYKSVTGGLMKNLRESTTIEKVRRYHKALYRPDNLSIIITGQVEAKDVFNALKPIEDKIALKGHLDDFKKAWQSPIPPLVESVEKIISFPSDDDNYGLVKIAWRGPTSNEINDFVALDVLIFYLTDTIVAPLQRNFVEIEVPYCSRVVCDIVEYAEAYFEFVFENVPVDKLRSVKPKFTEILMNLVYHDNIDLQRIKSAIHRKTLFFLNNLECKPHEFVAELLIRDVLHGASNADFEDYVQRVTMLKTIANFDEGFWKTLLKKYFLDGYSVTVIGEPSHVLMENMTRDEEDRILRQQESLAPSGLKRKGEELDQATKINNTLPPEELLSAFKIPDVGRIKFHTIKRYANYPDGSLNKCPSFRIDSFRVRFHLDDINSNFVMLHAVLDTSSLPRNLKLYLPLFLEALLESPLLINGTIIPHEEVVTLLAEDTLSSIVTVGIGDKARRFSCGPVAQMVHLFLQVEMSRYPQGVQWLYKLLFSTQFTKDRLKVIAMKMLSSASKKKRDGNFIAKSLINDISFTNESNRHACNLMRQFTFLSELCKKLELNPQAVIDQLDILRSILTNLDNITFHVATDVNRLVQLVGDPTIAWNPHFLLPSGDSSCKLNELRVQYCSEMLLPFTENSIFGAVVGVGSVESSYLIQYVPCNVSHTHPDLPALLVLLQYLSQLEGPMWKQIRGLGLAYGCGMSIDSNTGILQLYIYCSANVVSAYLETVSIVKSYLSASAAWDLHLLESAKSSLTFELIQNQETVKSLSDVSLLMRLNTLDDDYHKTLLKRVAGITLDDIKMVGATYLPVLIDATKARLAVCCHPSKGKEVVAGFKRLSRDLIVTTLEDSFLAKIDV